jgi:hypothetical protein
MNAFAMKTRTLSLLRNSTPVEVPNYSYKRIISTEPLRRTTVETIPDSPVYPLQLGTKIHVECHMIT